MKTKRTILFFLFTIAIILNSCQSRSEIEFTKTKETAIKSISSIATISSYSLRFNPKAYGTITIKLSNGEEYNASNLTSSQISSFFILLENESLRFDTDNEEFVLNK